MPFPPSVCPTQAPCFSAADKSVWWKNQFPTRSQTVHWKRKAEQRWKSVRRKQSEAQRMFLGSLGANVKSVCRSNNRNTKVGIPNVKLLATKQNCNFGWSNFKFLRLPQICDCYQWNAEWKSTQLKFSQIHLETQNLPLSKLWKLFISVKSLTRIQIILLPRVINGVVSCLLFTRNALIFCITANRLLRFLTFSRHRDYLHIKLKRLCSSQRNDPNMSHLLPSRPTLNAKTYQDGTRTFHSQFF